MFIEAGGTSVHCVEHGSGPRTAVFLHGFPVDHRIMTGPFEPVFARRGGWRRVYLDLPGMGATPAPPHVRSTDDVLAVVRAAIDALVPGGYTLADESYGGYLARGLVAAAPERVDGMCLVCPMIVAEHAEHAERDVPDGDPDARVVETPGASSRAIRRRPSPFWTERATTCRSSSQRCSRLWSTTGSTGSRPPAEVRAPSGRRRPKARAVPGMRGGDVRAPSIRPSGPGTIPAGEPGPAVRTRPSTA